MTRSYAPGRALELALLRAARYYASQGRQVFLQRQEHTPGRTTAHADLVGGVDGRAVALEAKMTSGDYFPLKPERAAQRKALQELHERGCDVSLVVEFTDWHEIFVIPWQAVQFFLEKAWRKSLSIDWCRASGRLVPWRKSALDCAKWLDAYPHPDRADATNRELAAREGKPTFAIDGDLSRDEARDRQWAQKRGIERTAGPEKLTKEQRLESVRRATEDGITNALKAAGKPKRGWNPRRAGGRR